MIEFWLSFPCLCNWSEVYHIYLCLSIIVWQRKNMKWQATNNGRSNFVRYKIKLGQLKHYFTVALGRFQNPFWNVNLFSHLLFWSICHFIFFMPWRSLASPHIVKKVKLEEGLEECYFILKYQNGFFNVRWCSNFWSSFLLTVAYENFYATTIFKG